MTELIESIRSYIISSNNGAILITGGWGSGKTYFIKNSLFPELSNDGTVCLYISLYGIRNINDVVKRILAARLDVPQSILTATRFLGKITNIASAAIPILGNLKQISSDIVDYINLFDFKNHLIVFDDLERISTDYKLSDFLGFINNEFIEHKGYKVIFVTNESKITDSKYSETKEKLISYTYCFESNINNIFNEYQKQADINVSWFYDKYRKQILDKLDNYRITNLRTIFFIFSNFNFILNILDECTVDSHSSDIILFIIAISEEIKRGDITIDNLRDARGLTNLSHDMFVKDMIKLSLKRRNDTKSIMPEETYIEYFTRFYLNDNYERFVFYNSIFKLMLTGYVSREELCEEIKKKPELNEWEKAEKIIQDFQEHDEETVKTNASLVLYYAKAGKYHPLSYAYLYHKLLIFTNSKILLTSKKTLSNKLISGFEKAKKIYGFNYSSSDLEYHSNMTEKDNILACYIKKEINKIEKTNEQLSLNEIYTISKDQERFYKYFSKYRNTPIFSKLSSRKFSSYIKNLDSQSIFLFCNIINERYNFSNLLDYFAEERSAITSLIAKLSKNRISQKKHPLKLFAINQLIKNLEEVGEKLNA